MKITKKVSSICPNQPCLIDSDDDMTQEYDNCGRKINSTRAVSTRIKNARKQFYNNFVSAGTLKGDPSIAKDAHSKKRRIQIRLKQLKQYSRKYRLQIAHTCDLQRKKTVINDTNTFVYYITVENLHVFFNQYSRLSYKKEKLEKAERKKSPVTEKNAKTFAGLSDDALFKACGGRTAHRAAKFGLGLGGKLARLEAQEKLAKAKREAKS